MHSTSFQSVFAHAELLPQDCRLAAAALGDIVEIRLAKLPGRGEALLVTIASMLSFISPERLVIPPTAAVGTEVPEVAVAMLGLLTIARVGSAVISASVEWVRAVVMTGCDEVGGKGCARLPWRGDEEDFGCARGLLEGAVM